MSFFQSLLALPLQNPRWMLAAVEEEMRINKHKRVADFSRQNSMTMSVAIDGSNFGGDKIIVASNY